MKRSRLLLPIVALLAPASMALAQQPAGKPNPELRKAELFIAITERDVKGARAALDAGADPNGRNWLQMTPIQWAGMRGNVAVIDLLLSRGAKREEGSIYGSALSFALVGRQPKAALHLLAKGLKAEADRIDGASPLMLAAAIGDVEVVKALLAKKADANKKDTDGATPLIYAARNGHTAAAEMLIKAGATVNIADSHGRTALLYAAQNGHSKAVDLLMRNKAAVNARDKSGATALHLAARYGGDAETVRRLLKAGANATATDGTGKTALALAAWRGYQDVEQVIRAAGGAKLTQISAPAPLNERTAVERGITVLQAGMKGFADRVKCGSCHHQGLGLMTVGLAGQRGYQVDQKLIGGYMKQMGEEGKQMGPVVHQALSNPAVAKMIPAVDIGDFAIGGGYLFAGLIANGVPSNPGLNELAQLLASMQSPEGSWSYAFNREPMQSSYITTTALVLSILRAYGDNHPAVAEKMAKAKTWLLSVKTTTAEDLASRLIGLKLTGASESELRKASEELLADQKADGGWSQVPAPRSDAYGTGLAVYALRTAGGIPAGQEALRKGIQYLLRTQDEDGSWYVNKRTTPANTYFDGGFPHGQSQYTSFAATCWATMALIESASPPQTAKR